MAHPNAQLMRKSGELLNAGDFQGFLELHTDDVVMHVPGAGPLSGDHHGREGIAAVFQKEASFLDAPPEFEDHDDLGSDHHAVGLVVQRLRRGGLTLEGRQTIIAHVATGSPRRCGSSRRIRRPSTSSSPRRCGDAQPRAGTRPVRAAGGGRKGPGRLDRYA